MRRPVMITMGIVVLALVGMMFAASMALKPYQQYARIGQDLTNILEMRSEIRRGSKVSTLAKVASEKHLAEGGWGMLIDLSPSEQVMGKSGRMEKLAYRAAREAADLYGVGRGKPLEWFEVSMELSDTKTERTLIRVDEAGRLGKPAPRLPGKYP